jgi:hypothetical protein
MHAPIGCTNGHKYSIPIGQKQDHVPEQLFDIVSGLGTGLNEHHIKFFGLNTRIYMSANYTYRTSKQI